MNRQQRYVLITAILASIVAFLDMAIINVALPSIARDVGGGLSTQQWIVDGYLITLGALILVAGSLSDLYGQKRIVQWGLIGFGVTSLLCAVAPNAPFLIIARVLQGIAGALLVPSALAMIITAFKGPDQGKAIGTWTAWTGIAFVIGPLLGGFLVQANWRLIFLINILPIVITFVLLGKFDIVQEIVVNKKVDYRGAVLCALGLGAAVFALIEQPHRGWGDPLIYIPLVAGLALLGTFLYLERLTPQPMLPLELFKNRNFSVGNAASLAIYAGLSVATFLIVVFLQQVGRYSALQAGLALLPVTIIMFLLSPRWGGLAGRYGPRVFMSIGPVISSLGFISLLRVDASATYWTQIFPSILLFGLGLSITVAPLTSAILGTIHPRQAGIASAINNAISRIAGLLAIAAIGVIVGPDITLAGFHRGVVAMSILLLCGGIISALGIQNIKPASRNSKASS